ncbi:MAG: A24 family peptidase [Persicimonas sp.]
MNKLVAEPLWAQLVIFIPLGAVLVAATVTDLRDRTIPNKLTYSSIPLGLVCATIVFGVEGLLFGMASVLASFVVGIFIAALGWIGGGDVKLLMGVGAFLGLAGLGATFFYAVLAGAILGLATTFYTGYLKEMLIRLGRFLRGVFRMFLYKTSLLREDLETDPRSHIPFALPILAGGIMAYVEAATGWPGLIEWFIEPFV